MFHPNTLLNLIFLVTTNMFAIKILQCLDKISMRLYYLKEVVDPKYGRSVKVIIQSSIYVQRNEKKNT